MLVPLTWLREYVQIKMPLPKLVERLGEVGIGVENIHKIEEDTVLELEITPNRPDLLSIVGIAREVAAIQKTSIKVPRSTIFKPKKLAKGQSSSGRKLPLTIKLAYTLSPRVSAIILSGVKIKESPLWLQERIASIGLRSINNIVDIANFVMFELGNPLHAFDYNQIKGHSMIVTGATGDELFTTVDKLTYKLPKGANVIKDRERIIDLCGIKGGLNSAITNKTKTVVLWVAVDDGPNIRRTSQILSLHSDASRIYERGVNRGGTIEALARATSLIRQLAGGHVSSDVIDLPAGRQGLKRTQFNPWRVELSLDRLEKLLGIKIEESKVLQILALLNLQPRRLTKQQPARFIVCEIPTYRNDLQIEEDLIEEVARLYGYDKFPKTLPKGAIPNANIPYASNFAAELSIKRVMAALGLSEVNTYSLVSREDAKLIVDEDKECVVIANPVSREFELLRPSLLINLLKAVPQNLKYHGAVKLFELGTAYKKVSTEGKESRCLAAVMFPSDFFDAKGAVEALFDTLAIPATFLPITAEKLYHKKKVAGIFVGKKQVGTIGEVGKLLLKGLGLDKSLACFALDLELLMPHIQNDKVFKPVPKYPPLIEDLSITVDREVLTGKLAQEIEKGNPLIVKVEFLDAFETTRTFRITYQHQDRNLSSVEVAEIRKQILFRLKKQFGAELKS